MTEPMVAGCVFCTLLSNDEAVWVAKRKDAVALAPLQQDAIAPGHSLVVPRSHCDGVLTASDSDLAATALLVRDVALAMQRHLGATGVCVLNASGPNSGRSVEHLHWHVVPRYEGDGDDCLPWPSGRSAHRREDDPYVSLAAALDA